jgi:argininosuccinate lyase
MKTSNPTRHHRPIWDRGEPIDEEMLAFTIGDDWLMDQQLVAIDIQGSIAHADGLLKADLLSDLDHQSITDGLRQLSQSFEAGQWNVEPADEDVHSAVERRLIDLIGEAGERLHLGRSRNDQVATDMRLWLRQAAAEAAGKTESAIAEITGLIQREGELPIPGYTHLRRAMPSTVADWLGAHCAALQMSLQELKSSAIRWSKCPLGSGSGYGVPLPLQREWVANKLGFDAPETPVTLVQLSRGRPELAYLTAVESIAMDIGKLMADLWLYSSHEFNFVALPIAFTTGSSMMPQKRNPDVVELIRSHCRQIVHDRDALRAVILDLPSGYHRDFQLIKPPLFRAHDRITKILPLLARMIPQLEFNHQSLSAAADDPDLKATAQALSKSGKEGATFRSAYRYQAKAFPG